MESNISRRLFGEKCSKEKLERSTNPRGLGLIKPSLPFAQASTKIIHSKTDVGLLAYEIPSLNETKPLLESNQIPTHYFYKTFVSRTTPGQQSSRQNPKAGKIYSQCTK
jgi:hypothetical protein